MAGVLLTIHWAEQVQGGDPEDVTAAGSLLLSRIDHCAEEARALAYARTVAMQTQSMKKRADTAWNRSLALSPGCRAFEDPFPYVLSSG